MFRARDDYFLQIGIRIQDSVLGLAVGHTPRDKQKGTSTTTCCACVCVSPTQSVLKRPHGLVLRTASYIPTYLLRRDVIVRTLGRIRTSLLIASLSILRLDWLPRLHWAQRMMLIDSVKQTAVTSTKITEASSEVFNTKFNYSFVQISRVWS